MERPRILLVDDEAAIVRALESFLRSEGYGVKTAGDLSGARAHLCADRFDLVLSDIRLPDGTGLDLLREIRGSSTTLPVILMTAYATIETAIEALKAGASDYLLKPVLFEDLLHRIRRQLEVRALSHQVAVLRRSIRGQRTESAIIGTSGAMKRVRDLVSRFGPTRSTVLIQGESGTGKDVVARELHRHSGVAEGPFLAINCSAIPESLLESELFGYRRGAFSGADHDRQGMFELASGGTLFLDEVGDLPLAVQPKLLRVLEAKEFVPLGATEAVKTDARILAATNRPLQEMVEREEFRSDLYYRLRLLEIELPPLREHPEDIAELASHLGHRLEEEVGVAFAGIEAEALARMENWQWPGNVRELENRLRRAMVLGDGTALRSADLWPESEDTVSTRKTSLREAVRSFERRMIRDALLRHEGDKLAAAQELGVSLSTLYAKLKELGD